MEKSTPKCGELFFCPTSKQSLLTSFFPKPPDEEWKKYMIKNDMDHELLAHKLANQTPILGKVNTQLKNKIFSNKTEENKKSSNLAINKKLVDLKNWTGKEISERQKWFAKRCLEVWKL